MYESMGTKRGGMHDAKADYRIMILSRTEDIATADPIILRLGHPFDQKALID